MNSLIKKLNQRVPSRQLRWTFALILQVSGAAEEGTLFVSTMVVAERRQSKITRRCLIMIHVTIVAH